MSNRTDSSNAIPLLQSENYSAAGPEESTQLIQRAPKNESTSFGLKTVAALICASAKIPSIPIALQLPFGPVFAAASSIAYWQLEVWAANNIIDDILTKSPDQFSTVIPSTCSKVKKIAVLLTSSSIAIVSLLPQGFAAAKYNTQPFKVPAALVTIISGAFFPLYSIQLSLNAVQLKKPSIIETKLNQAKAILAALVAQNKSIFVTSKKADQNTLIEEFDNHLPSLFSKNEIEQAFEILVKKTEYSPPQASFKDRFITGLSYINGGVLTATFLSVLAIYTFDETKEQLSDHPAVSYTFASLAVGSSLYLTGKSIVDTTKRAFYGLSNFFQGKRTRSLAEQHAPLVTLTSKVIAFFIDALSIGPTAVVFGEAFNQNEAKKIYVQTAMSLSVFLMTLTATLDMVDSTIETILLSKGSENTRQIIQLSRNYDRLTQLLNACSPLDIAQMLDKMPQAIRDNLFSIIQLKKMEFESFLKNSVSLDQLDQI